MIEVALQLVIEVAVVPLNFTVLEPFVEPKFVPVIVTDAPTAPDVGDKLVILGVAALPSTGVQTTAIKTRMTDSRIVMRELRFI